MNIALRTPRMTRDQFFDWAQGQAQRYEFDGFQPVAMTGGNLRHSQVHQNIHAALRGRLADTKCQSLGPDAGVATIGDIVRYPDALVTCAKFTGDEFLTPGVVVVFEVISPTSGRMDRITKAREYAAVPSILRYVIMESARIDLTVLERHGGSDDWTRTRLTGADVLTLSEIGIEIPAAELYQGINLPA